MSVQTYPALTGVQPNSQGIRITNLRGLRRWRAALASSEYGVARINCLGDSVTMGTYSNDSSIPIDSVSDAQGYVGRLRAKLARALGATAAGYMPANDSRNTLTGVGALTPTVGPLISTVRTDGNPVLGGALPLPVAATISFPVPACTTIEIIYLDSNTNSTAGGVGANTGTFSYAVDGGGATTTSADNTYPIYYKRITISGLANTTHTLLLTGVSATCYIVGIVYYGASGVVVNRLGVSGGTCLDVYGNGVVSHLSAGGVQRIAAALSPSYAPVTITASITSGSPTAVVASTTGLLRGMPIGANANIPGTCYIKSVDSSTQFTMSDNATATNGARPLYIGAGSTMSADLWVVALGHNDWQQQNSAYPSTLTVFYTALQELINRISDAGGCVLLVGEPKSNTSSPSPETYAVESYWAMLDTLAARNDHVASVQINAAWGTFSQAVALGFVNSSSSVHPLKKGSSDMAELLFRVLLSDATETAAAA